MKLYSKTELLEKIKKGDGYTPPDLSKFVGDE